MIPIPEGFAEGAWDALSLEEREEAQVMLRLLTEAVLEPLCEGVMRPRKKKKKV